MNDDNGWTFLHTKHTSCMIVYIKSPAFPGPSVFCHTSHLPFRVPVLLCRCHLLQRSVLFLLFFQKPTPSFHLHGLNKLVEQNCPPKAVRDTVFFKQEWNTILARVPCSQCVPGQITGLSCGRRGLDYVILLQSPIPGTPDIRTLSAIPVRKQ